MIPFDSIFDAYQWCDVTWHQNWIIDLGLIWTTKIQKLLKIILVQFLEWMIKCGYNHLYIETLNFLSSKKKATIVKFFTCQGQMGSYNILDWVNFDIYRAWKELSEQLISKFFKLKDGKN